MDISLTQDTPIAFGLHPNAEIDFRTTQSNRILSTILELQPRDGGSGEGALSPDEISAQLCQEILDKFGEKSFDTEEIARSLEDVGPYQNVFMQEMDVSNKLLVEMARSLKELQLGFAGELTMSDAMDSLKAFLFLEKIPNNWAKISWPTLRNLPSWLTDFMSRIIQLEEWQNNPADIPKVTWISGLTNPQSFLTAICQVTAQKNSWELDKLVTWTEVSKRVEISEVEGVSRDGAYITGLYLQGARWDTGAQNLDKSKPKEMFSKMPIINVKALAIDKVDVSQGIYVCPSYKTERRGNTYVFCAQLKTKYPAGKWVLSGVALIMDVQ